MELLKAEQVLIHLIRNSTITTKQAKDIYQIEEHHFRSIIFKFKKRGYHIKIEKSYDRMTGREFNVYILEKPLKGEDMFLIAHNKRIVFKEWCMDYIKKCELIEPNKGERQC